jgi:uncharacterized membrane protein
MPDSQVERFLSPREEQEIIQAILEAENQTSGEIRVHIEGKAEGEPYKRAQELFYRLKMDNTMNKNGVLFYVAVIDRKFAIYGDSGINKVVSKDFWNGTRDILQQHFKNGEFKQGLVAGILQAGQQLKAHFPWKPGDINELGNEISKA